MATVASIDAAVRANTSNFEAGMRRASQSANRFSDTLKSINKSVQLGIGVGALGAVGALAAKTASAAATFKSVSDATAGFRNSAETLDATLIKVTPIVGDFARAWETVADAVRGAERNLKVFEGASRTAMTFREATKRTQFENSLLGMDPQYAAVRKINREIDEKVEEARRLASEQKKALSAEGKSWKFVDDELRKYLDSLEALRQSKVAYALQEDQEERKEKKRRKGFGALGRGIESIIGKVQARYEIASGIRDFVREWFGGAEGGAAAGASASVRGAPMLESSSFGSKAAAEAIARAINPDTQITKQMLSKLEAIERNTRRDANTPAITVQGF